LMLSVARRRGPVKAYSSSASAPGQVRYSRHRSAAISVLSLSRCPPSIASDLSGLRLLFRCRFRCFPPSSQWECGNPPLLLFAGFPSGEGSAGNSFLSLEISRLYSVRHFYTRAPAAFSNSPAARPER